MIEAAFRGSRQKIFSRAEIGRLIDLNTDAWLVTAPSANGKSTVKRKGQTIPSTSDGQNAILKALLEHTKLQRVRMPFPYRTDTRFTWDEVPTYELIQSLSSRRIFQSLHRHALARPNRSASKNDLFQRGATSVCRRRKAIARRHRPAFRGKCRTSNNVITFRDLRICRLNGGNTHQLGVVDFKTENGEKIRITDVDARSSMLSCAPSTPAASAKSQGHSALLRTGSVKKLAEYLRKLNFTYPYHQAIGFYLEHAGNYKASQIKLMQRFPIEYDFYLNYQLKNPAHNESGSYSRHSGSSCWHFLAT